MDLNVTDGGYQYSTNINDLPDEIFLLMMENMVGQFHHGN